VGSGVASVELSRLAIAFNASLIPVVNSLFAVGLVSLQGMMTGQLYTSHNRTRFIAEQISSDETGFFRISSAPNLLARLR
jgi:Uncharacterised protein family (UPF0014)